MEYLYAACMGIVQGLAEFLPISSSGHLVIFQMLFGNADANGDIFFEVLLHFGTLIAVFVAFWPDIKGMIVDTVRLVPAFFKKDTKMTVNSRTALLIILSLLPLVVILPFKSHVEALFSMPLAVGIMLLVTAAILAISDFLPKGRKNGATAKFSDALFIGVCQLIAIVPGLSRSGTTITAGIFRGFSREFAVRFSFIMSIPTVLAAVVLEFADGLAQFNTAMIGQYAVGVVFAAISGYAAIKLVRYIAKKGKFLAFSIYCAVMGIFTILYSLLALK